MACADFELTESSFLGEEKGAWEGRGGMGEEGKRK